MSRPPSSPPPAPNSFDDLMSRLGVRRMDGPPPSASKKKAAPASAAAPAAAPPAAPAPAATPPPPPHPSQAALRAAQEAQRAAEGARDEAEAGLRSAAVEQAALNERLSAAESALEARAEAQPGSVVALLGDRGLRSPAEINSLLRALGEAHIAHELLQLAATDARAAAAFLDDRVSVVCERCPPSPGRPVVAVAPARCEVCGGGDIRRSVRTFVDAALMEGRTRVILHGGSLRAQRQLRELVAHRRLTLELRPMPARWVLRGQAPAGPADVILIWDRRAAELLAQGRPAEWATATVLAASEPTLAGLLDGATEALRAAAEAS
jgi:hypothetical protein